MWTIRLWNYTKKNCWLNRNTAIDFFFIYLSQQSSEIAPNNPKQMHNKWTLHMCVCVCYFFHSYFVWFSFVVWAKMKWQWKWLWVWVYSYCVDQSMFPFDLISSVWYGFFLSQISKSAFKLTIVHRLKLQLCIGLDVCSSISVLNLMIHTLVQFASMCVWTHSMYLRGCTQDTLEFEVKHVITRYQVWFTWKQNHHNHQHFTR